MAGPRYLTNRTLVNKGNAQNNERPVLRKFQLIAEYGGFYWVKAENGLYAPEMLTFPKKDLFDFDESNDALQARFKQGKAPA